MSENKKPMSAEEHELILEWVKASSNLLEYRDATAATIATGSPGETVRLCLLAALVPNEYMSTYMDAMLALHTELMKDVRAKMVKTSREAH